MMAPRVCGDASCSCHSATGAELVFIQGDDVFDREHAAMFGRWDGALPRHAVDRWTHVRASGRFTCRIVENVDGFQLITQGPHASSRRYSFYPDLSGAQRAAAGWARRRFYVSAR